MNIRSVTAVLLGHWLVAVSAATDLPDGAKAMPLVSAPTLSADGGRIVFEWAYDLWTASSAGGEAIRVVKHPARDAYPRFSPDGARIVFSSDRSGSLQVYSIAADGGGDPLRHTHHTGGCELECLSADGNRAIVRGLRDHPGYRSMRLMEIDLTSDARELSLFDATAQSAAWSPDGGRVLFCRYGEQLYRKGYRGSRASQIWLYRSGDGSFTPMVTGDAEARSPMWLPDGNGFYYVSNQTGTANLRLRNMDGADVSLTEYGDDGVITPELSADGSTMVFRKGLDLFRWMPGREDPPVAIKLWTSEALPDKSTDTRKITGTISSDFTADLKQVVFSAAGDLWRMDQPGGEAVRLTETSAAEEDVMFSPDGGWLYHLLDDGLQANYGRRTHANGVLGAWTPVTDGKRTKSRLQISPGGDKIAWVEGTGDVFSAQADGTSPKRLFEGWDKPSLAWSPDGRWLAIAAEDRDSNRDIWLAPADGSRAAVNLTRHPAFEGSPKWSPDGNWLVFSARRDESNALELWRMDFRKGAGNMDLKAVPMKRISTRGIEPSRVVWTVDSKFLWFQSTNSGNKKLYEIGVDGDGMRTVLEQRGVPIRMTARGELLWRVNRTPEILGKEEVTRFPIQLEASRLRKEVLTLGYRRIWRTLGERFYDPTMNGRDWSAIREKYEHAAVEATDSRQFDRVISLMRGELNASHLAFHQQAWPDEARKRVKEEVTAHPGLVFADGPAAADSPLRIRQVIAGTPVAMLPKAPVPGESVVRIAGVPVFHGSALHPFFNGAEKRPLPVVIRALDGTERVIELRCVSYPQVRALKQKARDGKSREAVSHSDPSAVWIPVRDMNRDTLMDLRIQVHRASQVSEKMILDLRGNGGGREADRMLNLFCQPAHSFTIPRDGPRGYPLDRRTAPAWDKALVVLCDEDTFSNSEIFCHAVKHLQRAPLVGRATAGGVISAIKVRIPDVGELQIPFRGWYHIHSGENFDHRGAQPDHAVEMTPADEERGLDPQLEKALELLR
jgi:tricorn protease